MPAFQLYESFHKAVRFRQITLAVTWSNSIITVAVTSPKINKLLSCFTSSTPPYTITDLVGTVLLTHVQHVHLHKIRARLLISLLIFMPLSIVIASLAWYTPKKPSV